MQKRGEEREFGKRGQITLFVIIAIIIVAIVILIYMFYPKIATMIGITPKSPQVSIQDCMEDELGKIVEQLSLQGGSLNSSNYYAYEGNKLEYLCYTEEFYKQCVMQQPMLKQHIEGEISGAIREKSKECFGKMKSDYERAGYDVNLQQKNMTVELLPKRIIINFNYPLTLTKGASKRYDHIDVILKNNLYEMVIIATSILNWEARYGDAETTAYMNYYPELKVEKKKQTDGTTVYILTERDTKNKFQFASRSMAWPAGL